MFQICISTCLPIISQNVMETSSTNDNYSGSVYQMEANKYKNRCPERIALPCNRYQPYNRVASIRQTSPASQEIVSILSKMNYRVDDNGFYVQTPAATSSRSQFVFEPISTQTNPYWNANNFTTTQTAHHQEKQKLPESLPLTPSCAYYKQSFGYPADLLPPTSIFTASLARGLMEEESEENDEGYSTPFSDTSPIQDQKQVAHRTHDINSILSLPQNDCDTQSYDFFESITDYVNMSLPPLPCITENYRPINESMNRLIDIATHVPADGIVKSTRMQQPRSIVPESSTVTTNVTPATTTPVLNPFDSIVTVMVDNKRRYECAFCNNRFNHRSSVITHLRIHTGEKPFACKTCGRCFSDNSTYSKHLRIHTQEKPYCCDVCGRGFSQSGNLNRHKKIHK